MMKFFLTMNFFRVVSIVALLFAVPVLRAQDPVPPPSQPDENSQQSGQTPTDAQSKKDNGEGQANPSQDLSNAEPPHAPVIPASALFRLGGAGFLSNDQSPLHLGPISLASAEALGAYNHYQSQDGKTDFTQTGSVMRADVVLAEQLKNVNFLAQWEPRLTIFDGHSVGDVDNGSADLDTHYDLTQRLSLGLNDRFSYFATRLLYGDFFLSSGQVQNPVSQQNSFLDTPGHSLNNNVFATLNYQITPLTQVSVSPSFYYSRSSADSALFSNRSKVYSGQVTLTHAVSPRTSVGLSYGVSAITLRQATSTPIYNSLTANYAHLLSPSLSFTASGGLSTVALAGNARTYSFTGNATLTKTLEKTDLAVNYSRGLYLDDYATTSFTDRVDGQINQRIGRRFGTGAGVGFQRESRTGGFLGKYASVFANMQLFPLINAYVRYTYTGQQGDLMLLTTGTRHLVVFGLRFQAPIVRPQESRAKSNTQF